MQRTTLDATVKLLTAAVRGIVQKKDPFVLKLVVNSDQVSTLVKFEELAKSKCAVTVTRESWNTALSLVSS